MTELDPEEAKLLTLARGARARAQAVQGAAVRDTDGRTYAGASVSLDALSLTAVQVAVALALSSGVRRLEAVAAVGADVGDAELSLLHEVGDPVVHVYAE